MSINIKMPGLYEWQKKPFNDIINDNKAGRTYVVKSKRQVGKSILAITVLLYFAFSSAGSIGVMVEPSLAQGRRVFRQMVKAVGGEDSPLIKSSNATLLEIIFSNGSQVVFKSSEQREALRGLTVSNSVLILDEAAFLPDDTFEILDPIVDATRSPVLILSTPQFRSGQFYERFKRGQDGSDFVRSYDWALEDTSALLTKEKLEYYRETMTDMKFRSEILGEFLDELSYVFGDFQKCVCYSKKPTVCCGIDWSQGEENDYTVAVFLDEDGKMTDLKSWKNFSPVDLVSVLAAAINEKESIKTVQVEKNSIGHIFYDMLRRQIKKGVVVKEFVTSNESKRSIIEQLIKAFELGIIGILPDNELKRQLQNYGIEKLKNGGYTYKGQNNVNDDYVIALALAYDLIIKPTGKFHIGFA